MFFIQHTLEKPFYEFFIHSFKHFDEHKPTILPLYSETVLYFLQQPWPSQQTSENSKVLCGSTTGQYSGWNRLDTHRDASKSEWKLKKIALPVCVEWKIHQMQFSKPSYF